MLVVHRTTNMSFLVVPHNFKLSAQKMGTEGNNFDQDHNIINYVWSKFGWA